MLFSILGASLGAGVLALIGLERLMMFRRTSLFSIIERMKPGRVALIATKREQLEQLFHASGLRYPWSVHSFLVLKRFGFFLLIIFLVLLFFVGGIPLARLAWIGIPLLYVVLRWPEVYCGILANERKQMVDRELPRLIDALLLYIRAGLNLEGAFREFAKRLRGVWGAEWHRFVLHLDRGVSFQDALHHLRMRFASDEFQRFLAILDQSRTLGVPLTDVLTIHAEFLRARRKQRAQELARTAAVKISLPLVFFIFPALMIVFLGPAIVQLMETL